jgi:hypothetical protein
MVFSFRVRPIVGTIRNAIFRKFSVLDLKPDLATVDLDLDATNWKTSLNGPGNRPR